MYGNEYDFYYLKGTIEELLDRIGLSDYDIEAANADCGIDEFFCIPSRTLCGYPEKTERLWAFWESFTRMFSKIMTSA